MDVIWLCRHQLVTQLNSAIGMLDVGMVELEVDREGEAAVRDVGEVEGDIGGRSNA